MLPAAQLISFWAASSNTHSAVHHSRGPLRGCVSARGGLFAAGVERSKDASRRPIAVPLGCKLEYAQQYITRAVR